MIKYSATKSKKYIPFSINIVVLPVSIARIVFLRRNTDESQYIAQNINFIQESVRKYGLSFSGSKNLLVFSINVISFCFIS